MHLRLLLLATTLVAFSACDSALPVEDPPMDPPEATAPLRAKSGQAFFRQGDLLGVSLRGDAGLQSNSSLGDTQDAALSASLAGVWASGLQDGQERASLVYYERTNFSSACEGSPDRLFALDADTTYTDTEAWPRDAGAPVTADGAPRVYGDQMLWGSFCTTSSTFSGPYGNRHADPLQNLRLNVALYGYERADLAGVRFVRYELTNDGTSPITDVRVGHFSDTETPGLYPGTSILRYGSDAVGYDAASGLSYVYQLPFQTENGSYSSTWVSGFTFLDTSVLSHRILRRYADGQGFGPGPASATETFRALGGLSYTGESMIDPTTDTPALFAFPTNPFEQTTGWLDGRDETGAFQGFDVRQLLSVGTTTLGAGETAVFTVVVVTAESGTTSAASYQQVQQTLAAVRAEPSLWRFTPES